MACTRATLCPTCAPITVWRRTWKRSTKLWRCECLQGTFHWWSLVVMENDSQPAFFSRCLNMYVFTQSWWQEPRTTSLTPPGNCDPTLVNSKFNEVAKCIFNLTNIFSCTQSNWGTLVFLSMSVVMSCRWKKYEIHDIVIECAKVSLDPKEASCEEGYSTMPENVYPQVHVRPQECTPSPYMDFQSSYGQ